MTQKTDSSAPDPTGPQAEPMVDARVAAVSLRLPHYWFADPAMRDRLRIPHYLLGGLVRYRMSEIYAWATKQMAKQTRELNKSERAKE